MTPSVRTYIALAICIASAVLGAVAIQRGWSNTTKVAFLVAGPWSLASLWLSGQLTKDGFARIKKPIGGIYVDARQGKLPKMSPIAQVLSVGSLILVAAGFVALFK